MRSVEGLQRVKEERNILHTLSRRKANWIGHIFRRNCLLKYIVGGKIEGRAEVAERRGRRRKQVLDELNGKKGIVGIERGSTRSHSLVNSH